MKQYRIDFKWREPSYGQAYRAWNGNYSFVDAESPEQAREVFAADWSSSSEFEILAVEKCGVQDD